MANHLIDPTTRELHGEPFTRPWTCEVYDAVSSSGKRWWLAAICCRSPKHASQSRGPIRFRSPPLFVSRTYLAHRITSDWALCPFIVPILVLVDLLNRANANLIDNGSAGNIQTEPPPERAHATSFRFLREATGYRSILRFVYLDISSENWKPLRQSPHSRIIYEKTGERIVKIPGGTCAADHKAFAIGFKRFLALPVVK
jgi:hypothetical protein